MFGQSAQRQHHGDGGEYGLNNERGHDLEEPKEGTADHQGFSEIEAIKISKFPLRIFQPLPARIQSPFGHFQMLWSVMCLTEYN